VTAVHRTIDAIWKMEAARIIGGLARRMRDMGLAEDLAQDALLAALEHWPVTGIPPNPGAWLAATARHKAIDRMRRDATFRHKMQVLGKGAQLFSEPDLPDEPPEDDTLRLIFTACHPVLGHEAQIALTLRIICGLTVAEIARGQLASEPTIQQRIVRAKRKLTDAKIGFEVPAAADRAARLSAVLQVIYLIYNEGYSASAGAIYLRQSLCDEALRLGRMLVAQITDDSECLSLLAMMELQS
jgi:RNA polymerase sigma-70 factor, ECF subfamily